MSEFEILKFIAKGSYGEVHEVRHRKSGQNFAMKIIQKNESYEKIEKQRQEGIILSQLDHKNIIKFHKFEENQKQINIIMELIECGSLEQFYKNSYNDYLSESQISQIMKGILKGLNYMHDKNIIHRDIKNENILIKDINDLSSIKIIDFGLSIQFQKENNCKYSSKFCGTQLFMAPELFQHKIYSKPVDIYSSGIIMFTLMNKGSHPIYNQNDSIEQYRQKVITTQIKPLNMNKLASDFFQKLTSLDPEERYTSSQALDHPWITGKSEMSVPLISKDYIKYFEKQKQMHQFVKLMTIAKYLQKIQNKCQPLSELYQLKVEHYCNSNKKNQEISLSKQYLQQLFGETKTSVISQPITQHKSKLDRLNSLPNQSNKLFDQSQIPQKSQIKINIKNDLQEQPIRNKEEQIEKNDELFINQKIQNRIIQFKNNLLSRVLQTRLNKEDFNVDKFEKFQQNQNKVISKFKISNTQIKTQNKDNKEQILENSKQIIIKTKQSSNSDLRKIYKIRNSVITKNTEKLILNTDITARHQKNINTLKLNQYDNPQKIDQLQQFISKQGNKSNKYSRPQNYLNSKISDKQSNKQQFRKSQI